MSDFDTQNNLNDNNEDNKNDEKRESTEFSQNEVNRSTWIWDYKLVSLLLSDVLLLKF